MTTLMKAGAPTAPTTGYRVRPTNYRELEAIADGLRPMLPKVKGDRFNIDCGKVLEGTLQKAGYLFRSVEVEAMSDCAAFTVPEHKLIVFREDIYDLVLKDHVYGRSTVIHEMSHIVLNHAATLRRGSLKGEHKHYEDSEWQAKALTAAIMMPLEACRKATSATELGRICGTSQQAATYRLDRLVQAGIIKPKDHYRSPV